MRTCPATTDVPPPSGFFWPVTAAGCCGDRSILRQLADDDDAVQPHSGGNARASSHFSLVLAFHPPVVLPIDMGCGRIAWYAQGTELSMGGE